MRFARYWLPYIGVVYDEHQTAHDGKAHAHRVIIRAMHHTVAVTGRIFHFFRAYVM